MFKRFYNSCFKYFLSLFFIFLCVIPVYAENSRIKIPEDKSIYLVVNGGPRVGDNRLGIPLSRVLKFDLEDERFYEIKTLDTVFNNITDIYPDFGFLTINNTDITTDRNSSYQNIYVVPINKPWEHQVYKKFFNEYLYPQNINNQDYLVSLKFNSVNGGLEPETSIINLSNLKKEEVPLDILKNMNMVRWLWVKGNKLYIKGAGLNDIALPYNFSFPDIKGLEKVLLEYNTSNYLVLNSMYHDGHTWIFIYDKNEKKWEKVIIKGEESIPEFFGDYMVVNIAYDQGGYSPLIIGEFEIINLKSGEKQNLELGYSSKVLIFNDNYLIVKDDLELLYIPVENGNIKNEEAITLYKEKESYWREKIVYIDAAFLGPKEIPEEVKIQRAIELNIIGEEYYHEAYYQLDKAIYYFKEAIKFNPEYALAYSNLGLAYYNECKYYKTVEYLPKVIENSKIAIELTNDDIIKASSYYNIAMAYEAMEEWEKALENYRKALEYRDHDAYREGIERMEEKIY